MLSIVGHVSEISGKRRYFISFVLGLLMSLSLPPLYIIPFAVIAFTAHFLQLVRSKSSKDAFWLGWWFGWGYFTGGLYWISFALLTDVEKFGWMVPFAIFGISAILAFYIALVSLLAFKAPLKITGKIVVFSSLWVLFEMLRGALFTGFPWNLIGYIWTFSDSMLQITSVIGIWGLSFITVIAFTMPATLFRGIDRTSRYSKRNKKYMPLAIVSVIMLASWVFGTYRLSVNETIMVEGVNLRIVQPNIKQHHKWDSGQRRRIVKKYLRMTRSEGFNDVTHVIWPESALPYYIEENSPILDVVKRVVPKGGAVITGSIHGNKNEFGFVENIWNSLHVINDEGKILDVYNKHHLVPFGEYVPFRSILPIDKITEGHADFSPGQGLQTISIPGLPSFSPLICYEAIFPGKSVKKDEFPEFIINVTNDAWYGKSSGPYQHFQMVRVRAIESGLPLVRSANTGISSVIDAYGRVVVKSKLQTEDVIDSPLPRPIEGKTIYSKFGSWTVLLTMLVFCAFFFRNSHFFYK